MFPRPLAFGIVVLAAMVAAAAGGYLATRHNALSGTAAVSAAPVKGEMPATDAGVTTADARADERPTFESILRPAAPETAAKKGEPRTSAAGTASKTGVRQISKTPVATATAPQPVEPPVAPPAPTAPPEVARAEGGNEAAVRPPVPPVMWEPAPPPPEPVYDELVVPAESVLGLQLDTPVSSETAVIEDRVDARLTREVMAGDVVAIPAGARVMGVVTMVEHGGKIRERGRLGIRFHTLILPDGTRTSINTDTVYRESASPAKESAAKIGGAAAGGAILGAILGGKKGAAIGGSIGAAGGTAVVMAGDEKVVVLPAGTIVNVRLMTQTIILVAR